MWIALKKQKIKRDGKYIEVTNGDPIPEAEFWANRKIYVSQRFIRWVPDKNVAVKPEPEIKVEIKKEKPKDLTQLLQSKLQTDVEIEIKDEVEYKPKKRRGRPKKKQED